MFSRFSEDAQKVFINSKKEMQDLKHAYVGSEHLFLSLLKVKSDVSKKLNDMGITYPKFKDKLIELVGIGSEKNNLFLYTPLLKRIIETSLLLCRESSLNEVTCEHLLFSLLEEGDGVAFRVPVIDGSVVDITLELEKNVTKEMVNNVFRSNQSRCLKYTEDPVVSSDIIGEPIGGLVDGLLTNVVECDGKQLVKVVAWYDNEVGYTAQMIRTMKLFI